MGGMKFEYDEEGGTFYYFLLSFVALIVFPVTYYCWPTKKSKDDQKKKRQCYCELCLIKRKSQQSSQPRKNLQRRITKLLIMIGWVFFFFLAYKTSQIELEFKEFDPYAELEIERGAEVSDIKKAYRRLSLIYHPDRETGDQHRFMRITKAHDALTDDEARKNWEEYGNPDGPGATQVGIALPKWIVEKQNSIWVLGLYALVFMVILPVCVGTWWYRSIKYSAQQVLIDTTRMYYSFLRKSPNMILKRVIMVLSGSYEFWKKFNSEINERPSDNSEIPDLIRDLLLFQPNPREGPFYIPYSIKARALLVAHFSNIQLSSQNLVDDMNYILKKCPYLLNEMLCLAQQLFFLTQAERIPYKLNLDTVDNIMRLSQMTIQGLWSQKSPFLQLPHINEDMLRHFVTKRRQIRNLKEFASMPDEDRRDLLRHLSEKEYQNVMVVLSGIPYNVEMNIKYEVKGEKDSTITVGSIVTVSVHLSRVNATSPLSLDRLEAGDDGMDEILEEEEEEEDEESGAKAEATTAISNQTSTQPKSKWQKNTKKKKGGGGGGKKNKKVKPNTKIVIKNIEEEAPAPPSDTPKSSTNAKKKDPNNKKATSNNNEDQSDNDSDAGNSSQESDAATDSALLNGKKSGGDDDEEDDEWVAFQKETKKDNILDTKSKETHVVHCPRFPSEKFEWWWLYLADSKKKQLISGPIQVTTLMDFEEKELRFTAPLKSGPFPLSVVLRSDSYLGVDQCINRKIDVKEAKKMEEPIWDITDDEEGEGRDKEGDEDDDDDDSDESYSNTDNDDDY